MKNLEEITTSILILAVWTVFHPKVSQFFRPMISRPLAKEKEHYYPCTRDGKTRAEPSKRMAECHVFHAHRP